MAFEIHSREFFDPGDDIDPEEKTSSQLTWRILSIVLVAAILIGLAFLFIGGSSAGSQFYPISAA